MRVCSVVVLFLATSKRKMPYATNSSQSSLYPNRYSNRHSRILQLHYVLDRHFFYCCAAPPAAELVLLTAVLVLIFMCRRRTLRLLVAVYSLRAKLAQFAYFPPLVLRLLIRGAEENRCFKSPLVLLQVSLFPAKNMDTLEKNGH